MERPPERRQRPALRKQRIDDLARSCLATRMWMSPAGAQRSVFRDDVLRLWPTDQPTVRGKNEHTEQQKMQEGFALPLPA